MFETSQKSYCWTPTKCSFAGKRLSQFAHLFISGQPVSYNHAACSPGFERGCGDLREKTPPPNFATRRADLRISELKTAQTVRWGWTILRRSCSRERFLTLEMQGDYFCASIFQFGCCLNPKGWGIGTPYHLVSTLWKIQVCMSSHAGIKQHLLKCKEVNS